MVNVSLRPWASGDLSLLQRGNTVEMTKYLAGPETDEQVHARHEKYLRLWREETARTFAVLADGERVGAMGWWTTTYDDEEVHEAGWFVVPEAQGHGIARAALALIVDDARTHRTARLLTAFPEQHNIASNALCATAGFTLHGTRVLPFRGQVLNTNAWVLQLDDLTAH